MLDRWGREECAVTFMTEGISKLLGTLWYPIKVPYCSSSRETNSGYTFLARDNPNYPERRITVPRNNKGFFSDGRNEWLFSLINATNEWKKEFLWYAQGLNGLLSKLLAGAQIWKMGGQLSPGAVLDERKLQFFESFNGGRKLYYFLIIWITEISI